MKDTSRAPRTRVRGGNASGRLAGAVGYELGLQRRRNCVVLVRVRARTWARRRVLALEGVFRTHLLHCVVRRGHPGVNARVLQAKGLAAHELAVAVPALDALQRQRDGGRGCSHLHARRSGDDLGACRAE